MEKGTAASAATSPGELCDAAANYNGELGKWWLAQAENPVHGYAYRNIAGYLQASFRGSPRLIIDYACGAGHLLTRLCARFPESRFIGFDGSSFLLSRARQRLARAGAQALKRTTLVETLLPDFSLTKFRADPVIYAFPNMLPSEAVDYRAEPDEFVIGGLLAGSPGNLESEDPERILRELMFGRMVSLNLRRLLRRGGTCVRVEYAKVRRHELSRADFMRIAFEEGSLDTAVEGRMPRCWFRVMASAFFRSRVTEDVYRQTGDERDRGGGYVITSLRAV